MISKSLVKRIIKSVFLILTIPLYLFFIISSAILRSDRMFATYSQALSLLPGILGVYFRSAFFSLACPGTSDEISIGFLTLLSQRNTTIKSGVYIGPQSNIGSCQIGKNTLIGSGVHILSGRHQHYFNAAASSIKDQGGRYEKIVIGEDCWIGNGSTVMGNVGSHCIIAAGSVVTRDIDEIGVIVAGNPAKVIGSRFKNGEIK